MYSKCSMALWSVGYVKQESFTHHKSFFFFVIRVFFIFFICSALILPIFLLCPRILEIQCTASMTFISNFRGIGPWPSLLSHCLLLEHGTYSLLLIVPCAVHLEFWEYTALLLWLPFSSCLGIGSGCSSLTSKNANFLHGQVSTRCSWTEK